MPRGICPNPNCTCRSLSEFPATLTELSRRVRVVELNADLETLTEAAECFDDALFTTGNDCALIVSRGAVATGHSAARQWRISEGYVNVRFGERTGLRIYRSEHDQQTGFHRTLCFADADGRIQHKVMVRSPNDEMLAMSFGEREDRETYARISNKRAKPDNVVSLCAAREMRRIADEGGFEDLINALVSDRGAGRGVALHRSQTGRVRFLDPRVLPFFIEHLAGTRTPFTRIVAELSVAQADRGPVLSFAMRGSLVFMNTATGVFNLDMRAIKSLRAVQIRDEWQLEIYDDGSTPRAILSRDEMLASSVWSELVLSIRERSTE
ncbi:MAG: hypothetical protein AAGD13_11725 [Pseudomonadota bacterium]